MVILVSPANKAMQIKILRKILIHLLYLYTICIRAKPQYEQYKVLTFVFVWIIRNSNKEIRRIFFH